MEAGSSVAGAARARVALPSDAGGLFVRHDQLVAAETDPARGCRQLFALSPPLAELLLVDGGHALARVDPGKVPFVLTWRR